MKWHSSIIDRVCERTTCIRLLIVRHFEKSELLSIHPQNQLLKMVTATCGIQALLLITIVNTTVGFSKWRMEERELLREPGRIKRASSELFIPDLNLIKTNTTFAEEVPNYPEDLVKLILEKEGHKYEAFFGKESVYDEEEERVRRSISSEDNLPCKAVTKIVYPKAATNKDGEWMFIIQPSHGTFQFVEVETCGNVKSCSEGKNEFDEGSSMCVQNYRYQRLLAMNRNGLHEKQDFKLPSSCVCAHRNNDI